MAERIRNERRARARRGVVASLALSSTVCLGVWKGGAPSSMPDSSHSESAGGITATYDYTSLAPWTFDGRPVTPWLAAASEQTYLPPLRIANGGAWDHWSAGTSSDHTSLGRATSLAVPLLTNGASTNSDGLDSGILTGLSDTHAGFVGPVGSWDKLGLGASPSLPTTIDKSPVIRVEHKCPSDVVGEELARVSHRVGRVLVGDFSSAGTQPLASAVGWASRASLLASPQLATGDDRLAFASSVVGPKPSASAPITQGQSQLAPEMAELIKSETSPTWLPRPTSLVEQLAALSSEPMASDWANEALGLLATIEREPLAGSTDERQTIEHLARLSRSAWQLAETAPSERLAVQLRQASLAIWRRAECWSAAAQILHPKLEHIALASNYTSVLKAKPVELRVAARPTIGRTDIAELLATIERYEASPDSHDARTIARAIDQFQSSRDRREQRLGEALDDTYRNANLRLSLSKDFLQLWLPEPTTRTEPVADHIVGTPVRGRAHVSTNTSIELIPDADMWRIALQSEGSIDSFTTARRGVVSVASRGNSSFQAGQQLLLGGDGIHRGDVVANVTSSSHFLRASSSYDLFPVVRGIVRNQARHQFAATRLRARHEVESKTEARLRTEFESKVAEGIAQAESRWQREVASRFSTAGIDLEGVEFRTTESRLVSRARLLEFDQLTAHTPRPRAPYDSLASVQIHESALRGLASTLQLDGARFTTDELRQWLSSHFGQSYSLNPEERQETAVIKFAPDRAVEVALRDGQLELTLSIYELAVRDILIRDFKVHSYYTPRVDGLELALERTEGPYFEGALRNRERMQLNTIFGKNQRQGERLELGSKLLADPRLGGLAITQLVIDDGWLGIALGSAEDHRLTQRDRYQAIR